MAKLDKEKKDRAASLAEVHKTMGSHLGKLSGKVPKEDDLAELSRKSKTKKKKKTVDAMS